MQLASGRLRPRRPSPPPRTSPARRARLDGPSLRCEPLRFAPDGGENATDRRALALVRCGPSRGCGRRAGRGWHRAVHGACRRTPPRRSTPQPATRVAPPTADRAAAASSGPARASSAPPASAASPRVSPARPPSAAFVVAALALARLVAAAAAAAVGLACCPPCSQGAEPRDRRLVHGAAARELDERGGDVWADLPAGSGVLPDEAHKRCHALEGRRALGQPRALQRVEVDRKHADHALQENAGVAQVGLAPEELARDDLVRDLEQARPSCDVGRCSEREKDCDLARHVNSDRGEGLPRRVAALCPLGKHVRGADVLGAGSGELVGAARARRRRAVRLSRPDPAAPADVDDACDDRGAVGGGAGWPFEGSPGGRTEGRVCDGGKTGSGKGQAEGRRGACAGSCCSTWIRGPPRTRVPCRRGHDALGGVCAPSLASGRECSEPAWDRGVAARGGLALGSRPGGFC